MNNEHLEKTVIDRTRTLFGRHRALVGMVHVGALPGTPRHERPLDGLLAAAAADAELLREAGFDALIVENMHDLPYLRRKVGPEIVASMSILVRAIRETVDLPVGVQILAGANREALAVAHAAGASFIRAEGFAYASVADEGLLEEADAGPLLRYRRMIGAEDVAIIADVHKKHSAHAITGDVTLEEQVSTAEFMGADGVVITGSATGSPTDTNHLARASGLGNLPVIVGSGADPDSIGSLLRDADAVIVGSSIKVEGRWSKPVDEGRARALVEAARRDHP
jgi:membrane complex biogenesis BtpA family protein